MKLKKRILTALLAVLMVLAMIPVTAGKAEASTPVPCTDIRLSCDLGKLGLTPASTMGQVNTRFHDNIKDTTTGAGITYDDSFFCYWNGYISKIIEPGNGLEHLDMEWQDYYYLACSMSLDRGYEWPTPVYGVSQDGPQSYVDAIGINVWFNGVRQTDILLQYDSDYDNLIVYIPVSIKKADNPLKVSGKTTPVKYSTLKKKNVTLATSRIYKFTNKGKGALTYKKSSGNRKITVSLKTGKITVKKGLAKGTYKVKVKVKAGGNYNYKPLTKTVTVTIKVK